MEAQVPDLTLTYFPYTFLDEKDAKRLLLYCDTIRLLQVISASDPGLPDLLRTSQQVQLFCPISADSLSEAVKQALLTCHQWGNIHRDGGLVELFRTFALEEDFEGSRTALVARLRQGRPPLAPEEVKLVNNAVFLLLAHQLDRDQSELDLELERIRGLENKFQAEAGIGIDEEDELEPSTPPLPTESDRARTQHSFQRLRAWTYLYWAQEKPALLLPLTTSKEVLGEIAERLPSELTHLSPGLAAMPLKQHRLATLPDPQFFSLEEILQMRKSLRAASVLDNWRLSFSAACSRLQQETLSPEEWLDLKQHLQQAADRFRHHWPTSEKPATYLQLECICYPRLGAELAFLSATGLKEEMQDVQAAERPNGITLLLAPTALAPDDTD